MWRKIKLRSDVDRNSLTGLWTAHNEYIADGLLTFVPSVRLFVVATFPLSGIVAYRRPRPQGGLHDVFLQDDDRSPSHGPTQTKLPDVYSGIEGTKGDPTVVVKCASYGVHCKGSATVEFIVYAYLGEVYPEDFHDSLRRSAQKAANRARAEARASAGVARAGSLNGEGCLEVCTGTAQVRGRGKKSAFRAGRLGLTETCERLMFFETLAKQ